MLKKDEIPSFDNQLNNMAHTIATTKMEEKYPINQILFGPQEQEKHITQSIKQLKLLIQILIHFNPEKRLRKNLEIWLKKGKLFSPLFIKVCRMKILLRE